MFILSLENMLIFALLPGVLVVVTVEIQNIIENGTCLQNPHIDSFRNVDLRLPLLNILQICLYVPYVAMYLWTESNKA